MAAPAIAAAQPRAGTWAVGWQGFEDGSPSVRYVATDNLALELIPKFQYTRSVFGSETTSHFITGAQLNALRRLADYGPMRVSGLVDANWSEDYERDEGPFKITKTPAWGAGAGFEVEYFPIPNFSLGAQVAYGYTQTQTATYSKSGTKPLDIQRSWGWNGQFLQMHYYFDGWTPSAAGASAGSAADEERRNWAPRGSWALGWMGSGGLYGAAAPSIKYVWSDKTALELIPSLETTHESFSNGSFNDKSLSLHLDVIRRIASARSASLSYVIQPRLGYDYLHSSIQTGYAKSPTYTFGLGAGLEAEYFVLPTLSVGAQALLVYDFSQNTDYTQTGYAGLQLSHVLQLKGQVFNVRWYFGGPAR